MRGSGRGDITNLALLLLSLLLGAVYATTGNCPAEVASPGAAGSGTEMMLRIAHSCRYDRFSRPVTADNTPTRVSVHVHVYFLGTIEAQTLRWRSRTIHYNEPYGWIENEASYPRLAVRPQFAAHLLVQFRWLDERLAYSKVAPLEGQVTSERQLKEHIWLPKIYLVNEKESIVVSTDGQDVLITVEPDGTVTLATRVRVTLFCLMALEKFPFDQQRCPMIFESWTYNTSQMVLAWEEESAVTISDHLHLFEYHLLNMWPNFTMMDDALTYENGQTNKSHASYFGKFVGNFTSLTVQFHLAREVGHYIMDYYVPSIFLVVVSWVSFWLDPNAVPGRTTLGTSTMLTFITLTRNIGGSLPKVSYIKATEIWFLVCCAFIFGSLVEFAFVNTIWRRKQNVELKKATSKYILKSTLTPQMHRKQLASNIDRCQSWPSVLEKDMETTKEIKNYYISNSNRNTLTVNSMDSIQTDPYPSIMTMDTNLSDNKGDVVLPVPTPGSPQPTHSFTTMTPQEIAQWIDERSRIVFPASFVLFNVLYWAFVWL